MWAEWRQNKYDHNSGTYKVKTSLNTPQDSHGGIHPITMSSLDFGYITLNASMRECVWVWLIELDRVFIFSILSFLRSWHSHDTVWYVSDVTSEVSMVTKSPSLPRTSFFPRDVTVQVFMVMSARNEMSDGLSHVCYIHPSYYGTITPYLLANRFVRSSSESRALLSLYLCVPNAPKWHPCMFVP
jgi:hypothetical protein